MRIKKYLSSALLAVGILFAAAPARAGIPVFDSAAFAQHIQQVAAWVQQYSQMVSQFNKLQQQFVQMQTMTNKLDGARALGTILNNPAISASLPPAMVTASSMLLSPGGISTSPASINAILSSFNVSAALDPNAGKALADGMGKIQAILASTQQRQVQLQQLAAVVDASPDTKASVDLLNRNTIEVSNITNQQIQTMALLESARQAIELANIARRQAFAASFAAGAAAPLKTYTY